ncbi:MAG: MerR family transcriptional regulator [Acidimicrobiales bacterium]|nr:MerR family transcriptional regulator [Acidimicrobiales bacterium]
MSKELVGYRAPQVCKLVGITYRQLDYWARTGLLVPSLQPAAGSGSQRLYSFTDVVQLKVIKRLLDAGMSLKKIRSAVEILKERLDSDQPLADVTLLSDGQTIYAAHSPEEVVDVFRRGQGVFGIAVGPVQDEVVGDIHHLFPDQVELAGVSEAGAT